MRLFRRILNPSVREVRELPDGFALRFEGDDTTVKRLWDFINLERKCCGFVTYELTLERNDGPVWLQLRGDEQAKTQIRHALAAAGVAMAGAGLTTADDCAGAAVVCLGHDRHPFSEPGAEATGLSAAETFGLLEA